MPLSPEELAIFQGFTKPAAPQGTSAPTKGSKYDAFLTPERMQYIDARTQQTLAIEAEKDAARIAEQEALERERKANAYGNDAFRAVARGIFSTGATAGGLTAMAGELLDSEPLKDVGMSVYRGLSEKAAEIPGVQFGELSPKRPLQAGWWVIEKALENAPFMIGTLGAGAIGKAAGQQIASKALTKVAGGWLENQAKKSLAKQGVKALTGDVVGATALGIAKDYGAKYGAQVGVIGGVGAMEAGGDYADLVERGLGSDKAVLTTLGTGIAKGWIETLGGDIRIIDRVLGQNTGGAARRLIGRMSNAVNKGKAISPDDVGLARRIWLEAKKVGAEEMGEEVLQEALAINNIAVNDPTFKRFAAENLPRLLESAVAGFAVGGLMGGGSGAFTSRENYAARLNEERGIQAPPVQGESRLINAKTGEVIDPDLNRGEVTGEVKPPANPVVTEEVKAGRTLIMSDIAKRRDMLKPLTEKTSQAKLDAILTEYNLAFKPEEPLTSFNDAKNARAGAAKDYLAWNHKEWFKNPTLLGVAEQKAQQVRTLTDEQEQPTEPLSPSGAVQSQTGVITPNLGVPASPEQALPMVANPVSSPNPEVVVPQEPVRPEISPVLGAIPQAEIQSAVDAIVAEAGKQTAAEEGVSDETSVQGQAAPEEVKPPAPNLPEAVIAPKVNDELKKGVITTFRGKDVVPEERINDDTPALAALRDSGIGVNGGFYSEPTEWIDKKTGKTRKGWNIRQHGGGVLAAKLTDKQRKEYYQNNSQNQKQMGEIKDIFDNILIKSKKGGARYPYKEDALFGEEGTIWVYAESLQKRGEVNLNDVLPVDLDRLGINLSRLLSDAQNERLFLFETRNMTAAEAHEYKIQKMSGMPSIEEQNAMEESYIGDLSTKGFTESDIARVRESGWDEDVIRGIEREIKASLPDEISGMEGESPEDVNEFLDFLDAEENTTNAVDSTTDVSAKAKRPLEDLLKEVDERKAKAKAAIEKNLALAGDAKAVKLQNTEDPTRYYIIVPSSSEKGRWQATGFDDKGAWGHTVFNSRDEAITALSGDKGGYYEPAGLYVVEETKGGTPAPQSDTEEKEYVYKSPLRPLWLGFRSALGVDFRQIDDRTFAVKKRLPDETVAKFELEPQSQNDPINVRKRYDKFFDRMAYELDIDNASEVTLDDGSKKIVSRNIDPDYKDEFPYRITRINPEGMPTGHDVFKDFDEIVRALWGNEKHIKEIKRGTTVPKSPDIPVQENPPNQESEGVPPVPLRPGDEYTKALVALTDNTDVQKGPIEIPQGAYHYIAHTKDDAGNPVTRNMTAESYRKLVKVGKQEGLGIEAKEKKGKEPWEMTRDEYIAPVVARFEKTKTIGGVTFRANTTANELINEPASEIGMSVIKHKIAIEDAVKQNKPVSQKVLKDYPDLYEKYGKKPEPKPTGEDKQTSAFDDMVGQTNLLDEKPAKKTLSHEDMILSSEEMERLSELGQINNDIFNMLEEQYWVKEDDPLHDFMLGSVANDASQIETAKYAYTKAQQMIDGSSGKDTALTRSAKKLQAVALEVANSENNDTKYSSGPSPWYYSQMQRFLETKLDKKGVASEWANRIKNWGKTGEYKKDELDWSGLLDWLGEQKGIVKKEDVLKWLDENRVEVKEVTLGEIDKRRILTAKERAEYIRLDNDYDELSAQEQARYEELKAIDGDGIVTGVRETKFSQYVLPGAKEGGYRELFVTLPSAHDGAKRYRIDMIGLGMGGDTYTKEEAQKALAKEKSIFPNRQMEIVEDTESQYAWQDGHSQYSDIVNPIVRVRFNERTDADGKRVLFLEEMQPPSKANQEKMPEWAIKRWREIGARRMLRYAAENGYDSIAWTPGSVQLGRYKDAIVKTVNKITWNPVMGKTDLAVYVDTKESGVLSFAVDNTGKITRTLNDDKAASFVGKNLDEVIGKEMAQEVQGKYKGSIEPEDMVIGGEGLARIYDKDLPNVFNKIAGKWQGKVGEAKIFVTGHISNFEVVQREDGTWTIHDPVTDTFFSERFDSKADAEVALQEKKTTTQYGKARKPVHSLSITPAMREAAMAGQPLFQSGARTPQSSHSLADVRKLFPRATVSQYTDGSFVVTQGTRAFVINSVEQISPDKVQFEIQHGKAFEKEKEVIKGAYQNGTITITKYGDVWTLAHEHYHYLEDLGVLTKADIAALNVQAALAGKKAVGKVSEEDRAVFVENALKARAEERNTVVKRIVQKVRDWIDALVGLAKRTVSARRVLAQIEKGTMDERVDTSKTAVRTETAERGRGERSGTERGSSGTYQKVKNRESVRDIQSGEYGVRIQADDRYSSGPRSSATQTVAQKVYDDAVAMKTPVTSRLYNLGRHTKEGVIAHFLTPFSTRLEKINVQLKAAFRKYRSDLNQSILKDTMAVKPLMDATTKMSRDDQIRFDLARKNADPGMMQKLIIKYGFAKEYAALRKTLDELFDRVIEVGYDVDYRFHMHPRVIKDASGFLKYLYDTEAWGDISEAFKAENEKRAKNDQPLLSESEKAAIADMMIRGFGGKRINASEPGNLLERKVKLVDGELNKFYHDSNTALLIYLTNINKAIETRRFFGMQKAEAGSGKAYRTAMVAFQKEQEKERKWQINAVKERTQEFNQRIANLSPEEQTKQKKEYAAERRKDMAQFINDQEKAYRDKKKVEKAKFKINDDGTKLPTDDAEAQKSIGAYVFKLIDEHQISEEQQAELQTLFQEFFNYRAASGMIDVFRNVGYGTTLGNFSAALTQIGDIAFSLYNAGVFNTIGAIGQAVGGKSRITKQDIGIERIAEEFSNPTKMSLALNKLFQFTGFAYMDRLGKEVLINASIAKYERMAQSNEAGLRKILEKMVPSNLLEETVADFKKGEVTDNVKLVAFNTICDFQPTDLGEMPMGYIMNPGGRVFYMMKTYYIKQLDVMRRECFTKIRQGDPEGFKNLLRLVGALMLMNAASDELKDWLFQRDTKFSDNVIDNGLRMIGLSRYSMIQAKRDGLIPTATAMFLPPLEMVKAPERDIRERIKDYQNNKEIAAGEKKGVPKEFNVWALDTWKLIPYVGMNYHFWWGGGRERTLNNRVNDPLQQSKEKLFTPEDTRKFLEEIGRAKEAERLTPQEARTKRGQFFRNQMKVRVEQAKKSK